MNHNPILSRQLNPTRLFIFWVLANLLGGFIVRFLENNGLQFMATLFLSGAIVGTFQWLVLNPLGGFRWWPIASALGWIVGVYLETGTRRLYEPVLEGFGLALSDEHFLFGFILSQLVWGLGMAIAQALVLHRRDRAAGLWIGASLVGMGAHSVFSRGFCATFCPVLPMWLSGSANGVGWAAYGIITGLVVIKLWGHSPNEES